MSSVDATTETLTPDQRNQLIFAFGSFQDYESLFDKINDQFRSNKKYTNSVNQLNFTKLEKESDSTFIAPCYRASIITKYYDLDLDLTIISPTEIKKLEDDVKFQCSEGVLLLLTADNSNSFKTQRDFLIKSLNDKEGSFMPIITTEPNQMKSEVVKDLLSNIDELIQIDLTEDNLNENETSDGEDLLDSFSGLDELINCIFVHPWSDIVLKDEKSASIATSKREEEAVKSLLDASEEAAKTDAPKSEDDAFNFEELLTNLSDYKTQADTLDFEERKKFAENIVLKFWESIGGDKDEIGDLSDL